VFPLEPKRGCILSYTLTYNFGRIPIANGDYSANFGRFVDVRTPVWALMETLVKSPWFVDDRSTAETFYGQLKNASSTTGMY